MIRVTWSWFPATECWSCCTNTSVTCFQSLGIGRPPGKMDPASFVLRPFNRQEREEVCLRSSSHNYNWQFFLSGHCMITDAFLGLFQLDFTMQTGLEAVKLLLLDGFDKSATFVNSRKSALKMGNGWKNSKQAYFSWQDSTRLYPNFYFF